MLLFYWVTAPEFLKRMLAHPAVSIPGGVKFGDNRSVVLDVGSPAGFCRVT